MSSVRNDVFIPVSRAFGYRSCFVESIRKPDSEGRIIRNGGTPFFMVRLAAHVSFARHGRALTGESPEHAQVVGNV